MIKETGWQIIYEWNSSGGFLVLTFPTSVLPEYIVNYICELSPSRGSNDWKKCEQSVFLDSFALRAFTYHFTMKKNGC